MSSSPLLLCPLNFEQMSLVMVEPISLPSYERKHTLSPMKDVSPRTDLGDLIIEKPHVTCASEVTPNGTTSSMGMTQDEDKRTAVEIDIVASHSSSPNVHEVS